MKLELLVIAGQLNRGEYVLESCTQQTTCSVVVKSSPFKSDPPEMERSERTVGIPRGCRRRVLVTKSSPPVEIQSGCATHAR